MEQFSNAGGANLDGAIDNAVTTITVKSPVNVPSGGTFRALIDSEYLVVTAVSGLSWTVERGAEGSTAASHLDGATVNIIVTKGSIDSILTVQQDATDVGDRRVLNLSGPLAVTDDSTAGRVDIDSQPTATGTTSSLPAAASANNRQIYLPTDGPIVQLSDGSNWHPYGMLSPLTKPPALASWTWVNQGSATATDSAAGLYLQADKVVSDNRRLLVMSAPGSTPYTITAAFVGMICASNDGAIALIGRDSSSGKYVALQYAFDSFTNQKMMLTLSTYNSPTSGNANVFFQKAYFAGSILWLRWNDDGTNRNYSVSVDGVNFVTIYSEARTTWVTADQIGWGVTPGTGFPANATLLSWKQT